MHGAFLLLQLGCKLWWDLGNEKDSLGEFDSDPVRRPCLYLSQRSGHSAHVSAVGMKHLTSSR